MGPLKCDWALIAAIIFAIAPGIGAAQNPPRPAVPGLHQTLQASLTVTMTVASSVGIVFGPDGEQRLILANAADPADNVSRIEHVQLIAAEKEPPVKTNQKGSKTSGVP
jgi:hypothetical protein